MKAKKNEPVIGIVEFYYMGTDKQFNEFLKAIIKNYLSEDVLLPDDMKKELKSS